MSDNTPQYPEAPDPWAPPESSGNRAPLDKPGASAPGGPLPNPVHDQPTVTSMPAAPSDAVPGVPPAPGPSAAYGYPAGQGAPGPTPGAYGYPPASPYPTGGGYPGYPGYATPGGWTGQGQPRNGFGITAMVLGIVSIPLFCAWGVVSMVLGIMAVVFGVLGRKRAAQGEATNGGMALAGIITGSVGILVGAVFLAFMVWAIVQSESRAGADPWGADSQRASAGVVAAAAR
ncbi:DUF4190 domain-containing protein [Streptomyces candidus]|uniref:DUF4190 domain-containing protein n=1 Tax=Streptomyces candidus TaxID=67283 RepID=A0A7X0LSE9_9ACTN|nr:DUF4190 domain-containing protein [Streptomyces candidus]MBB6438389.1 hypothetical protein [Streptomyces candidus]GHH52253.1 hypothetical protein GCM10018773_51940 [Streptomyces candidus]